MNRHEFPNRAQVERLRGQYPPGTWVELDSMTDPQAVPAGTKGKVVWVDDAGQLVMNWQNGRSLSLIPGEDSFHKVPAPEAERPEHKKRGVSR